MSLTVSGKRKPDDQFTQLNIKQTTSQIRDISYTAAILFYTRGGGQLGTGQKTSVLINVKLGRGGKDRPPGIPYKKRPKQWSRPRKSRTLAPITNGVTYSNCLDLDCVQRLPLNFSPYISLMCHVSVLFPPISPPCTAVPPKSFP
jgi:hypothetical protein